MLDAKVIYLQFWIFFIGKIIQKQLKQLKYLDFIELFV